MITAAIEKILGLAKVETLDIEDRTFTSRSVSEIKPLMVDTIAVHSLQGIVDFLTQNTENQIIDILPEDAMIHIVDPYTIKVLDGSASPTHRIRECFVKATRIHTEFDFGQWFDQEQMVIKLMTLFDPSETLDEVIQVVSGIVASTEVTVDDDGLSQEVQVRKGVSRVEALTIKNPIMLRPIRTFTEIEQPEAPHVLRVRCKKDRLPEVAIFEAGGGQWKNDAICRVKNWLRQQVGNDIKIVG